MYYNCVKFHKNSIRSWVGVALTRYMPPFRESISWIISPFQFWTATIFLHAHLQVVYYKCVKFHKNPTSRLGGVALTRYMDGRIGWFLYTPPNFVCRGIIKHMISNLVHTTCFWNILHQLRSEYPSSVTLRISFISYAQNILHQLRSEPKYVKTK